MANVSTDQVSLCFGWKGPNRWNGGWEKGGLDIKVVDLVFKSTQDKISVHLPENISPKLVEPFPFTNDMNSQKFDILKLTMEQVYDFSLRVSCFEESPRQTGPVVMDSSRNVTQQKSLLRSNRNIELKMAAKVESGHTYRVVVTSDEHLSLDACMIEEECMSIPIHEITIVYLKNEITLYPMSSPGFTQKIAMLSGRMLREMTLEEINRLEQDVLSREEKLSWVGVLLFIQELQKRKVSFEETNKLEGKDHKKSNSNDTSSSAPKKEPSLEEEIASLTLKLTAAKKSLSSATTAYNMTLKATKDPKAIAAAMEYKQKLFVEVMNLTNAILLKGGSPV